MSPRALYLRRWARRLVVLVVIALGGMLPTDVARSAGGQPTKMWTFNGIFPGPTIRRPTGQPTNLTIVNNLPAAAGSISTHNHGNHSPSDSDGQPADLLIPTGGTRTYNYPELEDGSNER